MKNTIFAIAFLAVASNGAFAQRDGAGAWSGTTATSDRATMQGMALQEYMVSHDLLGQRTTVNQYMDGDFRSIQECYEASSCQEFANSTSNVVGSNLTSVSSKDGSSVTVQAGAETGTTSQQGRTGTVNAGPNAGTMTIGAP